MRCTEAGASVPMKIFVETIAIIAALLIEDLA
jgi:hypothetical protein